MIIHANILDWAASYDGEPFHALLCDPPYHLTEIVKRFGKAGSAPAQHGTDGAFQRVSKGFMGKTWDGGDVAYRPETWAALAQHLYPGAFGMAFSGSRGWHRMAVAIEDAGLVIHPTIFCWNYASGFPKATRIDTQVDRKAGAKRAKVGTKKHQSKFAAAWASHRYGLQTLKPSIEPIIVFQRPYAGRPVDSITATGAGALNVDGGRIGTDDDLGGGTYGGIFGTGAPAPKEGHPAGRWPANFALVHHPACERVGVRRIKNTAGSTNGAAARNPRGNRIYGKDERPRGDWQAYGDDEGYETVVDWSCHPDCVVQRLGEQSGESESGVAGRRGNVGMFNPGAYDEPWGGFADSGTAARFFHQSDWMAERLEEADAVGYFAKASRGEREAGLDPRQIALMRTEEEFSEATINDGRKKSIDNPYQRGETTRRNVHPTIKPLSLCKWLATLLLPPAMYAPRRILIPFAGVASEMIGAKLAGWEEVVGVELEEEHIKIAQARLAYWEQMKYKITEASAEINVKISNKADDGQLEMF